MINWEKCGRVWLRLLSSYYHNVNCEDLRETNTLIKIDGGLDGETNPEHLEY